MMKPLVAFEDARLNASLVTILGLEEETPSAKPDRSRGWPLIPAGLRSSRKASAAVAASLAAMTCGVMVLYLNGGPVGRLDHRDGVIGVSRADAPFSTLPRDGHRPVATQPSIISGPSEAPSPGALTSSMPMSHRSIREPAEGKRAIDTPSGRKAVGQIEAIRPARLHPDAIAPSTEPTPPSIDAPRLMVAAQPSAEMRDADIAVALPAERDTDAVAVVKNPVNRAEARRTSVGAIRALRRQW